ncbi:GNAT family N-acetyltransferase [Leptodesmis sp.]|uniref:GNAT family N-acetyltransferase n=1 Tax=Leptodesmis sp. TaxID=3100501 RepID=UPI0040534CD0
MKLLGRVNRRSSRKFGSKNFSHRNMPALASLTVRPAKDSDLSQIVNLDRLAFAPLQSNEAIQQWYGDTVNLPGRKLFLAVEDETDQGIGVYTQLDFTAFFEGQEVPIMGIGGVAVAPHRRGQRVARLMLEHALKAAREQQIPLFGQQTLGFEFRDGQIHPIEDHPGPIVKLSIEHLTQLFCGVRRSRDLLWTGELAVEGDDSLLAQLDHAWQAEPPFCWDFF